MKRTKRLFGLFFLTVLFAIFFSLGIAVYEDIKVNRLVNQFIARANPEPVHSWELNGVMHYFFEVPRETSEGVLPAFSDINFFHPGIRGDIMLNQEFPFPRFRFFDAFVSYYFGGHAAFVVGPNRMVEATGATASFNEFIRSWFHHGYNDGSFTRGLEMGRTAHWLRHIRPVGDPNRDFFNGFYSNTFFVMRTYDRGYFNENIDIAVEYVLAAYEKDPLYNFLFWLNTNRRYYCTDLISRAFDQVAIQTDRQVNLNPDGFIVSINDIVLSPDTFFTIVMQTRPNARHIYFLADVD